MSIPNNIKQIARLSYADSKFRIRSLGTSIKKYISVNLLNNLPNINTDTCTHLYEEVTLLKINA